MVRKIPGSGEYRPDMEDLGKLNDQAKQLLTQAYDSTLNDNAIIKRAIDNGASIDQLQMSAARGYVGIIRRQRLNAKLGRR